MSNDVFIKHKARFDALPNNEFGYFKVQLCGVTTVIGKHNNLTREEIYKRVGCADKHRMPQMDWYYKDRFKLTYFND